MLLMEIANWEEGFEIAQSRRRAGRLSWVAMPTRHDSRGYRKLIRSDGGVVAFACWCVMVQVAARCSVRGILADDRGHPLDSEDLEAMTDIPASSFEASIPMLCKIGWLICNDTSKVAPRSEQSTTTIQTVHNKTEPDKTKTPHSTKLYQNKGIVQEYYQKLPENKRVGWKKWQAAFINEVIDEGIDPELVIKSIHAYYKSGEGQSPHFRNPATLIEDRVWLECPSSWDARTPVNNDEAVIDGMF